MAQKINKKSPSDWDQFPHGRYLLESIEESLAPCWSRIFGYHLLKLGALSKDIEITDCMVSRQFSLCDDQGSNIIGNLGSLPIQNNAIDAILATFLFEFHQNPYLILREMDRALVCGGYLILVGFNPLSLGFVGKILPKYQNEFPWCGHYYLPSRIKDWLALLGYKVMDDKRIVFHPMIGSMEKGVFLQKRLASWLPNSGSIYLIMAKKLDCPLTPIKEKRKIKSSNWSTVPSAGKMSHKSFNNN